MRAGENQAAGAEPREEDEQTEMASMRMTSSRRSQRARTALGEPSTPLGGTAVKPGAQALGMRANESPGSGCSNHVTQRKKCEASVTEGQPITQAWMTNNQPGIFEAPAELELEELEDEFDADLDAQTVVVRGLRGGGYA